MRALSSASFASFLALASIAWCASLAFGGCATPIRSADVHADAGAASGDDAGTTSTTDAGAGDAGTAVVDAGASAADAGSTATVLPEDPGPFAIATSTSSLTTQDGKTIGLTVVVPQGAPLAPVVVIHPGFMLDAGLYTSYAEHLATRGYVAILVAPPYALFGGPTHAELASYLSQVLDHVVAESSNGSLAGIADATRIGLAGHSLGGKIALLLATNDSRPLAVFGIDPVDAAGGPGSAPSADFPSVTPELMGDIHVPIALVGETTNATCSGLFCQPCAPADDNYDQYYANAASPALEVTINGASHMSFVDNPSCGLTCSVCPAGSDDPDVTRRLTRRATTAFFDKFLRSDAAEESFLTGAPMQADVASGLVVERAKLGM